MRKIDWKAVRNFAEDVCEIAAYGVMLAATYKVVGYINVETDSQIAGYDDAVSAIMKSDMYSHDKRAAVTALTRGGDMEFYRAIIHIAKDSSMYSHDKVDMIKRLSEK